MKIRDQVFKLCRKYRINAPYFDGAYLYATNGKTLIKIPASDVCADKNFKGPIASNGHLYIGQIPDFPTQPLQDDWEHHDLTIEISIDVKLLRGLCAAGNLNKITMHIPIDDDTGMLPDRAAVKITDYDKANHAIGYIMPLYRKS